MATATPTTSRDHLSWQVEAPSRLDAFLMGKLSDQGHSRVEIQGWIEEGRVAVSRGQGFGGETRALKRSTKLKPGDEVSVDRPPPPPPPEPLRPEQIPVPILYQDEAILVLNKPPHLTVHPGAGQRHGTLVSALLHLSPDRLSSVGGSERPGIVHRLDKDTSGVIVIARTDAAHRNVSKQFHDRIVSKRYLAIVDRVPKKKQGVIDKPLGRHPKDRKRQAVVEGGRAAKTGYEVKEAFSRHAFVECRPETGRTHQIRVHLKSLGTPIIADATYGRGSSFTTADAGLSPEGGGEPEVLLERQALHAARLELVHPLSGERVAFEAPLPADMQACLTALRKANS